MDSYSMSKLNRLYWLGRYTERTLTMTRLMMNYYDMTIDGDTIDYADICARLHIPDVYGDDRTFVNRYLFASDDQNSVISAASGMLDNAMTLRETISSPTLAYVQMAYNAMENASRLSAPCVPLQWVIDDIMAFRGSCDDSIDDGYTRYSIKSGATIERLSLMLRLGLESERIDKEAIRLLSQLNRTCLPRNDESYSRLTALIYDRGLAEAQADGELLKLVEGVCEV